MRKGAYAGPVTLGKQDVTVNEAPSSRSRAMAGAFAPFEFLASAALSVSGRTPSAMMTITVNSTLKSRTRHDKQTQRHHASTDPKLTTCDGLLANAPGGPIDLCVISTSTCVVRSPCHIST